MKQIRYLSFTLFFIACSSMPPSPKNEPFKASIVSKEFLNSLDFKGKELIAIPIGDKFYYIHKSGKKILTMTFDNKPDKFQDGLARTRVNGKVGFFNKNLEMVLPPIYDFAFPFYKGKAEICTGCKEISDGENSMLDGGRWQKIDRNGLVIE
jgi:hypothetical protein